MMKSSRMALAAAIILASIGGAVAKDRYPQQSNEYYSLVDTGSGPSLTGTDQDRFHESGTRGRLNLGADPNFPEGPGNAH